MPYYGAVRRAYQNEKRREWRAKIVGLLGGCCARCGATENLDAHHKDPSTKFERMAALWTRRWEIQEAELAKCELLCKKCHRAEHAARHGGQRLYRGGCRCDLCRAWWAKECARIVKHKRAWRQRRREADLPVV